MVTDVVQAPLVLIVRSDSPFHSVSDVVNAAHKEPGKLSYSSSGIGGSPHLATVMFSSMENIKLNHVPYQGSAPSVMSMLSGQTDMVFDTLFLTYPQVKAGKARALAQTGAKRSPLLPDVPTMGEAGLKGYEATSWLSLAVPANTPVDVIQKINLAANEVMKTSAFADPLVDQGMVIVGNTPAEAAAHLRREVTKWSAVVHELGAKAQ
jgi:tripartite-type tricarboxylate transporter receptor subunit TctC